ncbi:hypothetical protein SNL152K_646 [Streptomyces sp. NL15-2K]|nr:hypothetical protein SNL152K_646 [Streptomyces sp. NL15-2K]
MFATVFGAFILERLPEFARPTQDKLRSWPERPDIPDHVRAAEAACPPSERLEW